MCDCQSCAVEIGTLREQLAESAQIVSGLMQRLVIEGERAEAAEAKLKAESAPIGYVTHQVLIDLANGVRYGGARITPRVDEEDGCVAAIYADPVPPVDVQSLLAKAREEGRKVGMLEAVSLSEKYLTSSTAFETELRRRAMLAAAPTPGEKE